MADYSLPLQVKGFQFDYPGALQAAQQYRAGETTNALNQFKLNSLTEQQGALAAFNAAAEKGDPRAIEALRMQPELYAKVRENTQASEMDKLTANARAAMRVKGFAGPERTQAWQQELDQAAKEGRIPSLMYQRLRGVEPSDQVLDGIIGQAQKPTTDLERAHAEAFRAEAAEKQHRIKNEQWKVLPADVGGIYRGDTGEIKAPEGFDPFQAGARKEAAKEAPKAHAASQTALTDAQTNLATVRDLKQIAPQATTGTGADALLWTKKLIQTFGYKPSDIGLADNVGPTEYLEAAINKLAISEAKKLYPISNADLGFIQKAVGSIRTDPTALPLFLGAMERVYEREAYFRQLESEAIKSQPFPDRNAMLARVNKQYPSFVEGWLEENAQSGPASGPRVAKQNTGRLQPAPESELAAAWGAIQRGAPVKATIDRVRQRGYDPTPLIMGITGQGSGGSPY